MQCLKNYFYTDQFYKITEEGDQISMTGNTPYVYILHIYKGKKYHFVKPNESYKLEYPYKLLGLSVQFHKTFILPPDSFVIKGNEFTIPFLKWLCKHYLMITYKESPTITVIDEDACMMKGNSFCVNNTLKNDIKYII